MDDNGLLEDRQKNGNQDIESVLQKLLASAFQRVENRLPHKNCLLRLEFEPFLSDGIMNAYTGESPMQIGPVETKDVLGWVVPVVLTWIGSGVRKYLKAMQRQLEQAKDSVVALNLKIATILERVEGHGRELDGHERRLRHVEQNIPRKK